MLRQLADHAQTTAGKAAFAAAMLSHDLRRLGVSLCSDSGVTQHKNRHSTTNSRQRPHTATQGPRRVDQGATAPAAELASVLQNEIARLPQEPFECLRFVMDARKTLQSLRLSGSQLNQATSPLQTLFEWRVLRSATGYAPANERTAPTRPASSRKSNVSAQAGTSRRPRKSGTASRAAQADETDANRRHRLMREAAAAVFAADDRDERVAWLTDSHPEDAAEGVDTDRLVAFGHIWTGSVQRCLQEGLVSPGLRLRSLDLSCTFMGAAGADVLAAALDVRGLLFSPVLLSHDMKRLVKQEQQHVRGRRRPPSRGPGVRGGMVMGKSQENSSKRRSHGRRAPDGVLGPCLVLLESLNLSFCALTDAGAARLLSALAAHPVLRDVDLSSNDLTDSSMDVLYTALMPFGQSRYAA